MTRVVAVVMCMLGACGGKKDDGSGEARPPTAPTGLPAGVTVKPWTAIPDPPGDWDREAKKQRVDCDVVLPEALRTRHFSEMDRSGHDLHFERSGTRCEGFTRFERGKTVDRVGLQLVCGQGKADYDQRVRIANAWATSTDASTREAFGAHVAVTGIGRGALANETVLVVLDDDTDCVIELEFLVKAKAVGGAELVNRVAHVAVDVVKTLTPAAIKDTTADWSMTAMKALAVDCAPILAAIEKALPLAKREDPENSGDWGTTCQTLRLDKEVIEVTVMCFEDRARALRSVDTWPGRVDHVPNLGAVAQARKDTLSVLDDDTGCAVQIRRRDRGDLVDGKATLASRGEVLRAILAALTPAQIKRT